MRTLVVTIVLLFPYGTTILANEDPTTNETPAEEMETMASRDSSSFGARQNRMGGVELGYGAFVAPIFGLQLHGYYNLTPDLSLGLMYSFGSLDLSSELPEEDTVEIKEASLSASIVGLNARWFVGNSFYLAAALAQRQISSKFDLESKILDYGLEGTIDASTLSAVLQIGNQWQWDSGFSLGVEWLGASLALSSSSSGSLDETGSSANSATGETKEDLEKLGEDSEELGEEIGKITAFRALIISAGYSF